MYIFIHTSNKITFKTDINEMYWTIYHEIVMLSKTNTLENVNIVNMVSYSTSTEKFGSWDTNQHTDTIYNKCSYNIFMLIYAMIHTKIYLQSILFITIYFIITGM